MLKQIKNIEGVTSLSKEVQQKLNAGCRFDVFGCINGEIICNSGSACPATHPAPHPKHGVSVCCSGQWGNPEIVETPL